jgi:alcohol dehydrogenase class IV
VTRNSVLASPAHRVKVSLRGSHLLPRLAIVDPELTLSLPPDLTAATGLDALTQLVEPFVSQRANPLSDAICREGLRRSVRSLRRACQDGNDLAARTDLALASLCGGLALTNAGLGAVHGLAAPLGGATSTPHGAACARLLAPVMEANVRALRERAPGSPALRRYQELAVILTGDPLALIEDAVAWVEALIRDTGLLSSAALGLPASEIPAIVEKAAATNSMKANPVVLTTEELWDVLRKALQQNPRRP